MKCICFFLMPPTSHPPAGAVQAMHAKVRRSTLLAIFFCFAHLASAASRTSSGLEGGRGILLGLEALRASYCMLVGEEARYPVQVASHPLLGRVGEGRALTGQCTLSSFFVCLSARVSVS